MRGIVGPSGEVTLEGFAAILEVLAQDPRGAENERDTAYPEWVRSSVSAAGTKLRVLRYMLEHWSGKARGDSVARLLDVGGQVGAMAAYAAQMGFAATVVDLPHYVRRFSAILAPFGLDYRACDLTREPLPFSADAFDFVTYMDVIEHHAFSPQRALREIHRVLAPGGRLIVTTPNHTSLYNRLSLLGGRSVQDDFTYFFETSSEERIYPGHHREYTRQELRSALELTGFQVLECNVFDEDPASQLYCLRRHHNGLGGRKLRSYGNLIAGGAGRIFSAFRIPLGRLLWAVGQKPASQAAQDPQNASSAARRGTLSWKLEGSE